MRVPTASLTLEHYVRGTKAVKAWTEGSRAAASVVYRPPERIRLCPSLFSLTVTRPLRSAATDGCSYPRIA